MDISTLSLTELRRLQNKVEAEIRRRSDSARKDLLKRMQKMAAEHGLSLDDVRGPDAGEKPAPAAAAAAPKKAPKAKKAAPAKKAAAPAKKAGAPAKKRTPSAAFMKAMTPSPALAAVIGAKPVPRTEVTKKVWEYIKANKLQDAVNKRNINADAKLKPIFGKAQVTMFEMTKLINNHLS